MFGEIAAQEEEHVAHAIKMLRAEREAEPNGFDAGVHRIHEGVMTTLAEMLLQNNADCACDLCPGGYASSRRSLAVNVSLERSSRRYPALLSENSLMKSACRAN